MIWLISEILIYLMVALVLGIVAGLLWRGRAERAAPATPIPDAETLARARALESELAARNAEIGALQDRLAAAERHVEELLHERELQNRSIRLLHQQLEIAGDRERDRQVVAEPRR
jgi:TolA-binding protein